MRQHGAALILFATVLVLGMAWLMVSALGKASPTNAQREIKTGLALQAAKSALLGYIAQYAARTDYYIPGRLPCPEPLSPPAGDEGVAATSCSNLTTEIGRLPWRTLGIEQPRDGNGETLWYVLGPGFRSSPINFDTVGGIEVDDVPNAAVALIIAPGRAVNTLSEPGPPPAECNAINQQSNRYDLPFNPAKFLECGNEGGGEFKATAPAPWSNDRVIVITAAEVMDAIAGPVADRIQRQVAPALNTWRSTVSLADWGISYLPYASRISAFTDTTAPGTNDLCGTAGTREGMPPTASALSAVCSTSWSSGIVTQLLGTLATPSCAQMGSELRCQFTYVAGPLTANITATAPWIGRTFRAATKVGDITVTDNLGNSIPGSSITNLTTAVSPSGSNNGTLSFDISLPLLALAVPVIVRVPNLADAAFFSDPAVAWFRNNGWDRHTYYAIAGAARVNAILNGWVCATAGDPDCLTVSNLPASNGNPNDKRLVLVLMSRAIVGQSRVCGEDLNGNGISDCVDRSQYLEGENASYGDDQFVAARVTTTTSIATSSNDRVAACPFQQTPQSGVPITICN